ncbi:hypothetical protein [Streptomyces sp. NBC_00572]|uniref:hypothetical protein n=1 Tax=Streptomyces sp. NBC_00572 TaxID=2903664 RepID=UPI00225A6B0C|nr:hypothetical protein [Streptomyces sp. NBC_00572]MCX4985431.1 hypothetical protein [Streptomyces sp. NBC_00572]
MHSPGCPLRGRYARVLTATLALATLTSPATRALASTLVWAVALGVTVGIGVAFPQHRLIALGPVTTPVRTEPTPSPRRRGERL